MNWAHLELPPPGELPLLGDDNFLRSVLRFSSYFNHVDIFDRTLLQVGLYWGEQLNCVVYLNRFANIPKSTLDHTDKFGFAAIHIAAMYGFDGVVRELLNKGASIH
jgi:ankyrin repeat protein